MPFLLYDEKSTGEEEATVEVTTNEVVPSELDQVPLFLIPGITGNGTEFQSLIEKLRSSGDKRPIYVWYDPAIAADLKGRPYRENLTLQEQAKLMAECMKDRLPPTGLSPYVMISFSSGCSLSALAAQLLNAEGQVVKLFLIDGPSPEVARKYFSSSSESVTTDLINIVKYAAKLSVKPEHLDDKLSFNLNLDLNKLIKKSPLEVMDLAAQAIRSQYGYIIRDDFFRTSLKVAKLGIHNLMTNTIESPSHKIEKAYALITQETAKKYGAPHLGWDKYAETLSLFNDNELRSQEHTALLNDDGGASRLASKIKRFTNNELTPELMLELHLEYIRTRYLSTKANNKSSAQPSALNDTPIDSPSLTPRLSHDEVDGSPTTIETLSDDDAPAANGSPTYEGKLDELKVFFATRQRHTLFQQPPYPSSEQPLQAKQPIGLKVNGL